MSTESTELILTEEDAQHIAGCLEAKPDTPEDALELNLESLFGEDGFKVALEDLSNPGDTEC